MPPTPPDVSRSPASWPRLDGGETDVDTAEVREPAQPFAGHVESMLSTATRHLGAAGDAGADDGDTWDAAAQPHSTVAIAQDTPTDHHLRFLESVMAVVRKLNEAAHGYDVHGERIADEIAEISGLSDMSPTEPSPVAGPPHRPTRGQQ